MRLAFKVPFGTPSFGQVGFGLLKAFFKLGVDLRLFPTNPVNLSGFKVEKGVADYIGGAINNRLSGLKDVDQSLSLWHIEGSEAMIPAPKTSLLTFHETSRPSPDEENILSLYTDPIVSSAHSKAVFAAVPNIRNTFVGFDADENFKVDLTHRFKDEVHFGLMGKFEHRKHTEKIIRLWAAKYGNKHGFRLSCLVYNKFLDAPTNTLLAEKALGGKKYWNISFVNYLASNAEVNSFMNSVDVDLTGLSGGEGWNLPAFNMTCLGKWSVVLNATSHKDWATPENCILVEPSGMINADDGRFFKIGRRNNLGMFYDFDEESFYAACAKAVGKAKKPNPNGELLASRFSYLNMAKDILCLS